VYKGGGGQNRLTESTLRPGDRGNAFLELSNISKLFGETAAVSALSLAVRRGEFVSLLGPSGCGKTTTLRMVAGFLFPDEGKILLDGNSIGNVPPHQRNAAMVFQNYALFPHMTVFDNVAFGLKMHKVAKAEITRRVAEALEMVRLPQYGERFPRELSGGQQQRVALARAVVLNPKLLLLDEPLSNLDAKLRKELRKDFLEIHQISGITTLFVTHDLEEAFSISDRVAVMNRGRLEQFGTPVEIFNHPQSAFVADFVGHTNILDGTLAEEGGARFLIADGIKVRVNCQGAPGRKLRIAIPSHSLGVSAAPTVSDNCFPARIAHLSFLGSLVQIQIDLAGRTLSAQLPASPTLYALGSGATVHVAFESERLIEIPIETAANP
jgi:putative spermidine/putrescine transport system ATP-binding protein